MKKKLLTVILTLLPAVAFAGNSGWNPVGEYGETYSCDENAKANGYLEGSTDLSIVPAKKKGLYDVSVSIVKCPAGHLCDVGGIGKKEGDVLKVVGSPTDDSFPEMACEFEIRPTVDNRVSITQTNKKMNCEQKFLCGAYTGIDGEYPKQKNNLEVRSK